MRDRLGVSSFPPAHGQRTITAAAAVLAAALIGFGVVLWIAANWDALSKFGQFALVGAVIVGVSGVAAWSWPARVPALLVALLATGALLALFGQTYQTGADPWQLFALWAALTLPACLASRHDVTWTAWVMVAFTALSLWLVQSSGTFRPAGTAPMLSAWAAALAVTAVLGPWAAQVLAHLRGATPWAYRLAVLLSCALIVQGALVDLLVWPNGTFTVYLCAVLVLGVVVAGLANAKPLDLPAVGFVALALDVVLIGGVARLFLRSTGGEIASFLVIGVAAALIVAVSATALMRLMRTRDAERAQVDTIVPISTWPITVLSGVGAVFAAIPLGLFYSALFGSLLTTSIGAYLVGGLTFAGALVLLNASRPSGFGQQFGFIGLVLGGSLLGLGLYRDLSFGGASLVLAVGLTGTALICTVAWVRAGLGGAAALVAAASLTALSSQFPPSLAAIRMSVIVVMLAGIAALRFCPRLVQPAGLTDRGSFVPGWFIAGLLGLIAAAGPTFLLGGAAGMRGGWSGGDVAQATGSGTMAMLMSLACCVLAVAVVMRKQPAAGSSVGSALSVVICILAVLAPTFGPAILATSIAWSVGRASLAGFAAFTVLWTFGSVYYWLGWPLVHKAYLMVALGLGLAAVCSASSRAVLSARSGWLGATSESPAAAAPSAADARLAAALIALGALSTAASVGTGIWQNEAIVNHGRPLYLALAPVDPRSLMQGDYMALRFALPHAVATEPAGGGGLQALVTLDARGVGTIRDVVPGLPTALEADQILLNLTWKRGQWIIATDAFYFKEGTGQRYEQAKFGEFRFSGRGRPILVGLATADLQRIK
jgi:uncharacterized membrane-anchored protein